MFSDKQEIVNIFNDYFISIGQKNAREYEKYCDRRKWEKE